MKEARLIYLSDVTSTPQTSVPLSLGDLKVYSIQVDFSDNSIQGTLKLQVKLQDGANWVDLPSSTQAVTGGAAHVWNASDAGYTQVRIHWTYTAGAGTMTAHGVIKESPVKEG